jgi:hypothetical protein
MTLEWNVEYPSNIVEFLKRNIDLEEELEKNETKFEKDEVLEI